MASNRVARIKINHDLIRDRLWMPIDVELLAAKIDENGDLELTLTAVDLPPLQEAETPPLLKPIIHEVRWDWNLEGQ